MKPDFYRVLQVDPAADPEVLEAAYHRLARKFHPDVSAAADAQVRMRELNEAYAVLGDPDARAAYDRARRPRSAPRARVRVEPRPRAARPAVTRPAGASPAAPSPTHFARPGRFALALTSVGLVLATASAALLSRFFAPAVPEVAATPPASVVVFTRGEAIAVPAPAVARTPTPQGWDPFERESGPARVSVSSAIWEHAAALLTQSAQSVGARLRGPTPPTPPDSGW